MKAVLGVVLCGGHSRRMGRDKGLLPHPAGGTRAEHIGRLLESVCERRVYSLRADQLESYRELAPGPDDHVCDASDLPWSGPLLGILSTHRAYPEHDLLVLACDMLHMRAEIPRALMRAREETRADFIAYRRERGPEPLSALYGARGLAATLAEGMESGAELGASPGPRALLLSGNTHWLVIPEELESCFWAPNSPEEERT